MKHFSKARARGILAGRAALVNCISCINRLSGL
jgi:hypothetical protein